MQESKLSKRATTPGTFSRRPKLAPVEFENLSDHESYIAPEEEETKEISEQLSIIRKKHDRVKEDNFKKRGILEKLKKDYEMALALSQSEETSEKLLNSCLENIQKQLEDTRKQQNGESNDTNTYLYMLERMKKDKIAMDIKANSVQIALKSSKQLLSAETEKFRKVRETHFQSRLILRELQKSFVSQRKLKDDKVSQLERNIKSRQEAASRREFRQKKQIEIAEAASKDDKDSHEVKLRECLLLNKIWQNYLNKKLEKEQHQAIKVEKAFKKIKIATGLNDINDICERYLTREQNYATLISAVNESEKKLEVLKSNNEKARGVLQKMQLEDVDHRTMYNEMDKYDNKLLSSIKEYSGIKEKIYASSKIYDQIINWCGKITNLLGIDELDDSELEEKKHSLIEVFEKIYKKVEQIIIPMLQHKEETLKAIEKYAQKKTSQIIQEISKDESFSKISKTKVTENDILEVTEELEESSKAVPEIREDSRKKSKRNKQ